MSKPTTLVTGVSKGIGQEIATALISSGHFVVGLYNKTEPIELKEFQDSTLLIKCDISNTEDINSAFEVIKSNKISINNVVLSAGITKDSLLLMMKPQDWQQVLDTNLNSVFFLLKKSVPDMVKARKGHIVLLSSVVAFMGSPGQINYAATKAAYLGIARSLARELASRNITVNLVAPGAIDTDMLRQAGEKRIEELSSLIPLRRLGSVSDVANVVDFLCSDKANYITGAVIPVDGGLGMGL